MQFAARKSRQLTVGLPGAFGLLTGLALAPVLTVYASMDPQALWQAGGATALFIAGFTMFDFRRIRRSQDITTAPLLAASIFLDTLNVFLFFLQIFSGEDRVTGSTARPERQAAYGLPFGAVVSAEATSSFRTEASSDVRAL
jgi:FtsH-binding integral membrane protein